MSRERALGWLTVFAGLGLALVVQGIAPVGVPLYDGVIVPEPYRYLHPVGDQPGDPTSADTTKDVHGNQTPVFAVATDEQPPQAQMVAKEDAFQLPPGAAALHVTITPVDPTVQPTQGAIAGNVYRFAVTTTDGQALQPKSCDSCRTMVLRGPDDLLEGTIAHLEGGAWVDVATLHAGLAAMFQTNANAMGDYAILAATGGSGNGGNGGADLLLFSGVALALFFVAVGGLFWYRRRPAPVPMANLGPGRGRIPSKRKGPRRPPNGRSGS